MGSHKYAVTAGRERERGEETADEVRHGKSANIDSV